MKMNIGIQCDIIKRDKNIADGFTLCDRCSGTGNQLFSMYQKCEKCDGTGRAKEQADIRRHLADM